MTDIQSLIDQMTLEEKAALCTGASAWTTTPVSRLGIPELVVSDGPNGVRRVPDNNSLSAPSLPATSFPTASCMSSTWDVDLIHEIGEAIARECIALSVDLILGPGTNMKRSPLGGRNFEYFAEDPHLAGEMAAAFINGVQSKGVGTSLKHFAANNQEFQRFSINSEVDERTLHEIYLTAFEIAVKKSQPWSVMCAYNKLNGTHCSEHHELLTEILKDAWGFEGFVVSDWGAVHDRPASLAAGLDLEMPGPKDRRVKAVIDAVNNGQLDIAVLDESVRRILRIVFKAAEVKKGGSFDSAAHHALARKVAAEGMVLLKNNGILPLKSTNLIAVIGRSAQRAHFQGGGSSHVNPTQLDVPFMELQKQSGDSELTYCDGYPADDSYNQALIDEAVTLAQPADVALLYIALPSFKESEGYDRADLDLTAQQVALIKAVSSVQPNTVVVLNSGSAVVVGDWIDNVSAVIQGWMMGQAGAGAIADILYGKVNPSGKLTETFPVKLSDTPSYLNFPGESGEVRYGEGLFIGYRYYDTRGVAVQFPFGYGLSYTTFAYSAPSVSARNFNDTDGLTVSVKVTNTGSVAGKEVVQVYVHDKKSKLIRPVKELKGFAKVALAPGETKTVTVMLDTRAFSYYHPLYHQWITESGEFDILIGASATDIHFTETVTMQSTMKLPCILNRASTVRDWLDYEEAKPVFQPIWEQMQAGMASTFGGGDDGGETIGMDTQSFALDLPLLSLFEFQENMLPMPSEEIVDYLLNQVYELTR